jgi:hypothetical protein
MPAHCAAFTPAEGVAPEMIREDRPELVAALSQRLAPVLEDLVRTSQRRIVTEADADEFLLQLRGEFVGRMMVEMEPWGEDEDLRAPVVDLLTRRLLVATRASFVKRVVRAKRN